MLWKTHCYSNALRYLDTQKLWDAVRYSLPLRSSQILRHSLILGYSEILRYLLILRWTLRYSDTQILRYSPILKYSNTYSYSDTQKYSDTHTYMCVHIRIFGKYGAGENDKMTGVKDIGAQIWHDGGNSSKLNLWSIAMERFEFPIR